MDRTIYQKLAYTIMITAFAWVVMGDLVNMHIKLIYEKDLCAHSTLFTKTVSKDKSSHKASFKTINPYHTISCLLNSDGTIESVLPVLNIIFNKQIFFNTISLHNSTHPLRGPPSA